MASLVILGYAIFLFRKVSVHKERTVLEEVFLQTTLRNTIDSIYLKDKQSRILLANDTFIRNMERPVDKVYGHTDIDFFGEEFGSKTIAEEKRIMESGEPMVSAVEERVIETGSRNYVLTTKVPVYENGKVTGIFGITREFSEIAKLQEELEYSATHDSLTGLWNRPAIVYELHKVLENQEAVAVLFIDMDNFKKFNDGYGHDFGDELLKLVSRRIEHALRKDDLIGRLSGDEFVVILRNIETKKDAEAATKKLIESFRIPFIALEHTITCSFSIGISCTTTCHKSKNLSVEDLIRCADRAMYAVKEAGKGGYQFYEGNCGE